MNANVINRFGSVRGLCVSQAASINNATCSNRHIRVLLSRSTTHDEKESPQTPVFASLSCLHGHSESV